MCFFKCGDNKLLLNHLSNCLKASIVFFPRSIRLEVVINKLVSLAKRMSVVFSFEVVHRSLL